MAFCVSCGSELVGAGKFCPNCGAGTSPGSIKPVTTIEKTGKQYKAAQVAAVGVLFLATACFVGGWMTPGLIFGVLGLGVYIWARAGAWWHHG